MRKLDETELLVGVIAKAVIAVLLVGVVAYSVVAGVPISDDVMKLVFLVLAVYCGFSARVSLHVWRVATRKRKRG